VSTLVNRAPQDTRGNWKTYLGLCLVLIFSAFPVYWMFVIATSTDAAVSQIPPSVVPGSQLFKNLHEVFTMQEVYFTASLINSVIVSGRSRRPPCFSARWPGSPSPSCASRPATR